MEEANAAQPEGLAPVNEEALAAANGNGLPPMENGHAPVDEVLAAANGHAPVQDEVLAEANGNGHIILPPPADVAAGNEHAPVVMIEEIFGEDGLDPVDEAQQEVVPLVEEPDDQDGLDPVPVVTLPSDVPLPADRQIGETQVQVLMDGDPIQHWFNLDDDVEAGVENNRYAYRLRISSIYRSMLEGETVEDTRRRLVGNQLLVFDNNVNNLEIVFKIKIRTRSREDFEAINEALDREIEGAFDLFGLEYQM